MKQLVVEEKDDKDGVISEKPFDNDLFLACEQKWIFTTLMFISGIYGAYTYTIRGGVFCNAQTGNFVLFGMAVGGLQWGEALYYFIPFAAYLGGTMISEAIPKPIKKSGLRWDTILIFIEIVVVIILGLLPEDAPYQIAQVAINFICSMQYNTFRQAQGVPMATTFCTNHLRQIGVNFVKSIRKGGDEACKNRALIHVKMLSVFSLGCAVSTFLCYRILGKAIWIALIPLVIIFVNLLHADLKTEKGYLGKVPRGH